MITITQTFTQYVSADDAQVGDIVIHADFGVGMVVSALDAKEIVVLFDRDYLEDDTHENLVRDYAIGVPFRSLGIVRCADAI